jgi:predicted metal-dependent enzyme (double-stranded beta helix superfamily)
MATFDVESFIADCRRALDDTDARATIRELKNRTMEDSRGVARALGRDVGGLNIIHSSADLTVANVIWAPRMVLYPHDHRMWAAIGIYQGTEDNTLYRRGPERIAAAGGRELNDGDVLMLGPDAIHSVQNPLSRFTGAIHVYGGDFVNEPRSQWDPDTLAEQPWDLEQVRRQFAIANAEWAGQLGQDLDEHVS